MSEALRAQIEARNAEKAGIAAEIARQEPVIAEVQGRLTAARRKVAEVQNRLNALKQERAQIEQRFARRVGTRSEGVEDARKQLRDAMVAFATDALSDETTFGEEFAEARSDIARAEYARKKAERDVKLHETAIASADAKKVTQGIAIAAAVPIAILLVIALTLLARSPSAADYAPAPSAAPSSAASAPR